MVKLRHGIVGTLMSLGVPLCGKIGQLYTCGFLL